MIRLSLGLSALLLATACSETGDTPAPSEPAASQSETVGAFEIGTSYDASGYFLPNSEIAAGGWTLDHLFVGHSTDFIFWREAGGNHEEIPVWLSLNPVEGETATNELGQTYYLDARRIRPDSLTLTDGAFEFRAQDEALGVIVISGMIHPEFLHMPGELPHSDAAALTAGLEMGGEQVRNASFMHWLGD